LEGHGFVVADMARLLVELFNILSSEMLVFPAGPLIFGPTWMPLRFSSLPHGSHSLVALSATLVQGHFSTVSCCPGPWVSKAA
jgi:hypothetical protein